MLLGVLGCIDFTVNLSKSLVWHILIGWCKPKGLNRSEERRVGKECA